MRAASYPEARWVVWVQYPDDADLEIWGPYTQDEAEAAELEVAVRARAHEDLPGLEVSIHELCRFEDRSRGVRG